MSSLLTESLLPSGCWAPLVLCQIRKENNVSIIAFLDSRVGFFFCVFSKCTFSNFLFFSIGFLIFTNSPCCNKNKLNNVNVKKKCTANCNEKGMGNIIATCFPEYTKGCILDITPYSINQFPRY